MSTAVVAVSRKVGLIFPFILKLNLMQKELAVRFEIIRSEKRKPLTLFWLFSGSRHRGIFFLDSCQDSDSLKMSESICMQYRFSIFLSISNNNYWRTTACASNGSLPTDSLVSLTVPNPWKPQTLQVMMPTFTFYQWVGFPLLFTIRCQGCCLVV